MKKTVFITGATGIMGFESLKRLSERSDRFDIRILARRSKKNIKKLAPFQKDSSITVEWGDLLNYEDVVRAMGDADIVLHIGGMVSPEADHYPQTTMNVNITAARNITKAVKLLEQNPDKEVKVVYIGSIAETGSHDEPCHWGRTGDPILVSPYDYYGVSKVLAEREIVESGLKKWVVLRQSGILHPGLLAKGMDPITFAVPLRGVLEWSTLEDSGRLMANICEDGIDDEFWNKFYHIGSGDDYRLSNYEFEKLILEALNCPPPEKVFEPSWFATRNFHGFFFEDADKLEHYVPFRENVDCKEYFKRMSKNLPWFFKLTKIVPASLMKMVMRHIAFSSPGGAMSWFKRNDSEEQIKAHFKSREAQAALPAWKEFPLESPSKEPHRISHGYDETKNDDQLDINDMQQAAEFRGGRCVSTEMEKGNLREKLEWECAFGHRFHASPLLVLKGGHWCEHCLPAPWRYDEEARKNPFLAQIWHAAHDADENEVYDAESKIKAPTRVK